MKKIPNEEIIRSIKTGQQALFQQTGLTQTQLYFNNDYTSESLVVIKTSGINFVINPTVTPTAADLATEAKAAAYASKTPWGAIVSVSIGADSDVYINTSDKEKEATDRDTQIINSIEWLIKSFLSNGVELIDPEAINSLYDPELDTSYLPEDFDITQQAEVFNSAQTSVKAVALTFDKIGDDETMTSLLDTLDSLEIKATFFVTGQDVIDHRNIINMILEKGHNLGNGGYTGSNITMMDHQEIYLEIEKGKKIIQKEFGIDVKIYQPENGYINNTIKESAYYADSIITTFNKSPKNDPENHPNRLSQKWVTDYLILAISSQFILMEIRGSMNSSQVSLLL